MSVKCFEVVADVIAEANKRFSPHFKQNNERYDILWEYCGAIDGLVEEFDGEALEVEVDETKMTINVKLECPEVTVNSRRHRFYDLIERTVSCSFSAVGNDMIAVKFAFPSIWDKV